MGGRDDQVGSEQGAAADEIVDLLVEQDVEADVPGHHRVVDGVAKGRELLDGCRNLSALLIAALPLTAPVAAGQTLDIRQRSPERLEAGGADELHLGARWMVAFTAINLLPVINTRRPCGIAAEQVIGVAARVTQGIAVF